MSVPSLVHVLPWATFALAGACAEAGDAPASDVANDAQADALACVGTATCDELARCRHNGVCCSGHSLPSNHCPWSAATGWDSDYCCAGQSQPCTCDVQCCPRLGVPGYPDIGRCSSAGSCE